MLYSDEYRSASHLMLPTIPNLSVWGFIMQKGFRIGQHLREIQGTSKSARTFGHTVFTKKCDILEVHFLVAQQFYVNNFSISVN